MTTHAAQVSSVTEKQRQSFENLLSRLNNEQKLAVSSFDGPIRIVSGAGTGKTTTLTLRIANLMVQEKASARDILAVTFTNKAAREMRERIVSLVGDGSHGLTLGTFHAVSMSILRHHAELAGLKNEKFLVADTDDQIRIVELAMDELGFVDEDRGPKGKPSKEFRAQARKIHSLIQKWKEDGLWLHDLGKRKRTLEEDLAYSVWVIYQKKLLEKNSCDFADLIAHVVQMFKNDAQFRSKWSTRWRYICVDEFQDTNELQLKWLKFILGTGDNIYVIGDPDQSIYAWRNAKADVMSSVLKDWPDMQTIVLKTNYRSSQPILDAANRIVDENIREMPKVLESGRHGETPKVLEFSTNRGEAEYVARTIKTMIDNGEKPSEIAILVRSAFVMRIIEQELTRHKIPYKVSGGLRFFERQEIKDAIAYLKLLISPNDDLALERVINRPTRGIGDKTANRLTELMREGEDLVGALRAMKTEKGVTAKAKAGFEELASALEVGMEELSNDIPFERVLRDFMARIHYEKWLMKVEDDTAAERIENLKEMYAACAEHSSAEDFLVSVTLNAEREVDGAGNRSILLSTVHAAKGMEFDVVFSPALEMGIMPNGRALQERSGMEEERRICHVAWTRARKTLSISYALSRNGKDTVSSPFIETAGLEIEAGPEEASQAHSTSRFFKNSYV